jgi:hypothetical protein
VRIYDNNRSNYQIQECNPNREPHPQRILLCIGYGTARVQQRGIPYQDHPLKVKDNLGVQMIFTNALDHVPEAERNNRTIKERVRAAYHRLPYKALPRTLIQYLVTTQVSQLNLFPAKGGISPYYSPRTILGLPVLDYEKRCGVPFGAYIQANHETDQTNLNAARTLDAIYLRPAINMQGGHELYDLNSNRVITRAWL